jgi:hypothetical protein
MTISPEEYRQKLLKAFDREALKAMMMAVGDAYRTTPEHCKRNYDAPDRHDVIGHIRRARVHEAVRGVAERYSLDYQDIPNVNGSCFFLSITSGEIRLVCCLVATKKGMVRPAKIRELLAAQNFDGQPLLPFMEEHQDDTQPIRIEHLAVLIHAPAGKRKDQAGFIDIVIPNRRFTEYLQRVELFGMFPNEAEQYRNLFKRKRKHGEAEGA